MEITNFSNNILKKSDLSSRVIGIYRKNSDIRRETLNRNIGIYDSNGSVGNNVGELYNIYQNEYTLPQSLYNDQYRGKYSNYIDYIYKVYSNDLTLINWLDYVYSNHVNIPTKFDFPQVGVVRTFNVWSALNNVNMTNINNNSFGDTPLGTFTNYMFAATLDNAAFVNTKRNAGNKYITRDLDTILGVNDNTINNLTRIFNRDESTGKVLYSTPFLLDQASSMFGEVKTLYDFDENGNQYELYYYDKIDTGQTESWNEALIDQLGGISFNALRKNLLQRRNYILNPDGTYAYDSSVNNSNLQKYGFSKKSYFPNYKNYGLLDSDLLNQTYPDTMFDVNTTGVEDVEYEWSEHNIDISPISSYNTGIFTSLPAQANDNDILYKTKQLFIKNKLGTLVSRFHTERLTDSTSHDKSLTQSAVDSTFGMSMGRNLLTKEAYESKQGVMTNNYDNPYCRVWTWHHQYGKVEHLIRPFSDENGIADLQKDWTFSRPTIGSFGTGGDRLAKYSVLNNNGFVNITPTNSSKDSNGVEVKKCMFSIENLAWKGINRNEYEKALSPEQRGPLGGRIMWFPPYDIKFSENVSVNWKSSQFIGRGESVYSYANTERSGNLSFKILVDHPSIIDYWENRDGNSGKTTEDLEQELLRFFAGCGTIKGKPFNITQPKKVTQPEEKQAELVPVEPDPIAPETGEISFYVFYPNNYSGMDDKPTSEVPAMNYLVNGNGTQKEYDFSKYSGSTEDVNNIVKNAKIPRRNVPLSSLQGNLGNGYEIKSDSISKDDSIPMIGKYGSETLKWYYRVDNNTINQRLILKPNYIDSKSFKLNSDVSIINSYNAKHNDEEVNYSFLEVFAALTNDSTNTLNSLIANQDRVNELKTFFKKNKITKVRAVGISNSHGNNPSQTVNNRRNEELARNRAKSVIDWLKTKSEFSTLSNNDFEIDNATGISTVKNNDINSLDAKVLRCAKIYISYEEIIVDKLRDTEQEGNDDSITSKVDNEKNIFWDGDGKKCRYKSTASNQNDIEYWDEKDLVWKDYSINETVITAQTPTEVVENNYRYDDESNFFQTLGVTDPIVHKKLVEKIKYFDPAFHSITPEGFNARLTFLQQCTRQGHTIGATDGKYAATANNLAFGRPPVCVLRLGDFYNTKIIIENMSIEFEPLQWDLNPEGIGVQPMICDINLSFKFIGGSDLAGPIARLQNAVSFNYYANTGVYDNRADLVQYDTDSNSSEGEGKMIKFHGFDPSLAPPKTTNNV